jgi:acyl-CoA oxidase
MFNHFKIPHLNMLARFQYIDAATSEYKRRGSPALVYGGMTYLRVGIAFDAATSLARAAVVAIRYAAIRKQFADEDTPKPEGETSVLNYKMVQFRLLPQIAASYALHFAGRELQDVFARYEETMAKDVRAAEVVLAELHLKSCAMKAYATTVAVEGIETCRRACGGHGYSHYSGLGHLYAEQLPSVTFEGDNYMLTKQVARSLLKAARRVLAGKGDAGPIDSMLQHYLERQHTGAAFDVLNDDADLVGAFAWRVAHITFDIVRLRDQEKETWNNLLVPFWRLHTAFAQYLTVSAFYAKVSSPQLAQELGPQTAAVFTDLFRLYALSTMDANSGEFSESGAVNAKQFGLARHRALGALLDRVRPHALPLVEGWAFSDLVLNSSLGRSDGKAYEDMFRKAASNPVNTLTFDVRVESDVMIKRTERVAKL